MDCQNKRKKNWESTLPCTKLEARKLEIHSHQGLFWTRSIQANMKVPPKVTNETTKQINVALPETSRRPPGRYYVSLGESNFLNHDLTYSLLQCWLPNVAGVHHLPIPTDRVMPHNAPWLRRFFRVESRLKQLFFKHEFLSRHGVNWHQIQIVPLKLQVKTGVFCATMANSWIWTDQLWHHMDILWYIFLKTWTNLASTYSGVSAVWGRCKWCGKSDFTSLKF